MAKKRVFEGTKKKVPFTIETTLTDAAAIKILRERSKVDDDFMAQCADAIEISGMKNVKVKVKPNLLAWGFRMASETGTAHESFVLPDKIRNMVQYRKPLNFEVAGFSVKIAKAGERSKYTDMYTITDGGEFRNNKFYGRATVDGTWLPTRETPEEVVNAIKTFGE
jgi:hypothetical protein